MEQNKEKFSDGKLSTYLTVKNNFGFEKYLDKIKNFEQRRTLTRFRISAHKLAIEVFYSYMQRNIARY
jgi:hypothetical protein